MKLRKKELFFALIIPIIYAIVAFATIGDYGINPDEPAHFHRGQAYLHFFLTGKKNYNDLSSRKLNHALGYKKLTKTISAHNGSRRSFYQDDNKNGEYFIDATKNQSHPPLNDTLSALGNYIFYQKLNWINDVDSHHIFGLISIVFLLLVVYMFARINYGYIAGLVAALSVALYPVFLGESHFNVKDPPETAFFTMTVFFFWLGIVRKRAKWILISALACALALGTKFNIVFIPFIILPWLLFRGRKSFKHSHKLWISFVFYPLIVVSIFFLTNPNLWNDTWFRLGEMVRFYLSVGTESGGGINYQQAYLIYGFNTYPILAVLYKTPLVILFFSLIGVLCALANIYKDKNKTYFLLLLWLVVPILRVSLPGMTIYGGIRHIFEYIPAMAILAGIGASQTVKWLNSHMDGLFGQNRLFSDQTIKGLIILSFLPITFKLISIHPNENVYFNPLIGGLKGAKKKDFPYWGSSLGNTYLQGLNWVNKHAERNACLGTPIALLGNVPSPKIRSDITYHNTCLSGKERLGEYAMDMVYQGYFNDWYSFAYYDTYLKPVYEVVVDGVTIFKVFKNDLKHTKHGFEVEKEIYVQAIKQEDNIIAFSLPRKIILSQLDFEYSLPKGCSAISDGFVLLSVNGRDWKREADNITVAHGRHAFVPKEQKIERRFAAKPTKYIKLVTNLSKNCKIKVLKIKVLHHPNILSNRI